MGHKELIRSGETGLLFSAEDPQALADAVFQLHADPALVERIKRQGREFVTAERSWKHSVDRYEAVYANALAGRGR